MKIVAEKKVITYALVYFFGQEFRVWPKGQVERWDEDFGDYMIVTDADIRNFDEIKEAGLAVLA